MARAANNTETETTEYKSLNLRVELSEYEVVRQVASIEGQNLSQFVHEAVNQHVKKLTSDPNFKSKIRARMEAAQASMEALAG